MTQYQLVDSQQAVLGANGAPLRIRPQSYQVFSFLLSREGQIVSKQELFETVWDSVIVTDDSLTQCISDIRKLLGPEYRGLLQTIPKKGYRLTSGVDGNGVSIISRFDDEVRTLPGGDSGAARRVSLAQRDSGKPTEFVDEPLSETAPRPSTEPASENRAWTRVLPANLRFKGILVAVAITGLLATVFWFWQPNSSSGQGQDHSSKPPGPSIVVYPFNALPQRDADYFSEGVSADTVLALSRLSNLRVLPFRSIREYQTDPSLSQTILTEFNPQYALTGSVWRVRDRMRLNVELTDARNGGLLWSEQYDEVMDDVFDVQDRVARSVATALSVNLTVIETQRAIKKPTENMIAYDYVLTGRHKFRLRNREDNFAARLLFNKAIELDPLYAEAHIALGETYVEEAMFGYSEWPDNALNKALQLAQRAVKLDDRHAGAIGFLAMVYFRHDKFALATVEVKRALALNPNDPELYILKGLLLSREGRIAEAIEVLEYARYFDPEIKSGWTELGGLYYLLGDAEKAILTFERGLSWMPHIVYVHVMLAAAYVEVGKIEQAKKSAARVLQIAPFFDSQEFSRYSLFSSEEQRSRLLQSLASAGLD